ncbi:MAG: hypothetical protein ACLU84_02255 [Clostridia bacterium]
MYYQSYEDYMRNILGYPVMDNYSANTYEAYPNEYYMPQRNYENECANDVSQIESLYPDIYRIVNPMVCQACSNCRKPMCKQVLEEMTEEIYQKISVNQEIMVHINVDNRSSNEITTKKEVENRSSADKAGIATTRATNIVSTNTNTARNAASKPTENRGEEETRQIRVNNPLLRDLIRILILNQILGGNRPPQRPPRPPFPGPGMPPPGGPRKTTFSRRTK